MTKQNKFSDLERNALIIRTERCIEHHFHKCFLLCKHFFTNSNNNSILHPYHMSCLKRQLNSPF